MAFLQPHTLNLTPHPAPVAPYFTVHLQDILSFEAITGKLTLIGDLRSIVGVPEQRIGGRPNDYRISLSELIAIRASQGRTLKGRNEEAKALHLEFIAQFPSTKCPSLSTIKKYVSEARAGTDNHSSQQG